MADILEVNDVSKQFKWEGKRFDALKGVSFSIKKGEIFGLLGPNGAGKTTIINILLGILSQDSGSVKIFGKPIGTDVLERMNLVTNDSHFHWVLSCRDILEFYGRVYGIESKKRTKRIKQLSKTFGIEKIMDRRYSYLSTGEKMRLNFAKALINHPDLLLLDEPTLGLDPDIAIKVRTEIKKISRKFGTTILLTSHYMQEVEQLCERIAFIYKGKLVDIGDVNKIKSRNFSSYDIIVETSGVKSVQRLEKHGFKVYGNILKKRLDTDENISKPLTVLNKLGINVINIETKKPTLEDYFIKITSRQKGARK